LRKKITVVGAGNVGTTTAQLIAERDLSDVVLIDIIEGVPQGKALDIQEACPLWNSSARVVGTNSYDDTGGSDIVVITAGLARKPGMSRDDLLQANARIVRQVAENIAYSSPGAVVIVVTNPMDVMAQLTWNATGLPSSRVIGMGGILDSARMRAFIALETGYPPKDIQAMVLGCHGDHMVPMTAFTTIGGKPVTEVLSGPEISGIIERTKNGGAEIVGLIKTGSAYYAPAASIVQMIEAMLKNSDSTLPCSVYLEGEYGISGVYLGVPVILSPAGLKRIVEYELTEEERRALSASAESVRELSRKLGL
jgi:malate dehydrogenase